MTKATELINLSKDELLQKEKTLKDQLFKLNLQRYAGRVEKPHMFQAIKKDIARIHTILSLSRNSASRMGEDKRTDGINEKKEI